MTAVRGAALRVAGADAHRRASGCGGRACATIFDRYELARGRDRDDHRTSRSSAATLPGSSVCEVAGPSPGRRRAALRDLPARPLSRRPAGPRRRWRPSRRTHRSCSSCSVGPNAPRPQADLAPLRPHERHEHPGRARRRRRRAAAGQGHRPRAWRSRSTVPAGAPRRARPVPRRRLGGGRGRPQRRLLRRRRRSASPTA